jgi:hypothetical protein
MIARPLMTRYFLVRFESWALFLHHFHRSDLDEFHDHPWTFITFLVSGGYWEHVQTDDDTRLSARMWRRRFSLLYRPAEFQHFIEIEKPTWTIVLRFRERREWGFTKNGVWTWWRKFEDLKSRSICEELDPNGGANG